MDITTNIESEINFSQMERVPTVLSLELKVGYITRIGPRSGHSIRKEISSVNSSRTIDPDYRGEVSIFLINFSRKDFVIKDDERICKMVISKHEKAERVSVNVLDRSKRGTMGFRHIGKE